MEIAEERIQTVAINNLTDLHLNDLNLSKEEFEELAKKIVNLTSLTELYCYCNNNIQTLPIEICNLTNLTILSLGSTGIQTLPPEIVNLTSLTRLNLGGNNIQTFQQEIFNLINLTHLDLAYNQIQIIPKEIEKLINLITLDLSNNQLEFLPKEISELPKLKNYIYIIIKI